MNVDMLTDGSMVTYLMVPFLICLSRICDVTLGTLRIVYISKGIKSLAAVIGFFEVVIWLFAIGQIMQNLNNVINYIAYAIGYSMGNYIGIFVENKLSVGTLMLRVFTKKNADELMGALKSSGYGVTLVRGSGIYGPVDIFYTIIRRKDYNDIINLIKIFNPHAVFTVEEVKYVNHQPFPMGQHIGNGFSNPLRALVKRPVY